MQQSPTDNSSYQRAQYTNIIDLLIDPTHQLRLLWQHKWGLLGLVVVFALIGALLAFSVKPVYRSTASVIVKLQDTNVAPVKDVLEEERTTGDLLTYHEILRSRDLAGRIVDELNLLEKEGFVQKSEGQDLQGREARWKSLLANLPIFGKPKDSEEVASKPDPRIQAIQKVRNMITVESVPYTYIVKINADSEEPEFSALLANTLVAVYLNYGRGERTEQTEQASGWLNDRLLELKTQLAASERKLQAFYEQEDLVSVGGARELLEDEYADNSKRLRDARKRKAELQSVYQKIREAKGDISKLQNIKFIESEDLVLVAKRNSFSASESVGQLSGRYGDKHPKMIAAKERLDNARASYEKQLWIAAEAIKSEYDFAISTEKALSGIVENSRQQLKKLDRKQHTLEALQHEVTNNRALFDSFMQRFKETDISKNLQNTKTRVIDPAVPPTEPFKPNKKLWVLVSAILGFLLGFILIFLRAFLNDTVKSASALEELAGVPVLAVLPKLKELSDKADQVARLELDDPGSAYAEGIRTLRTSVMLADAPIRKKRILIASSVPSEGKTCVAANLAIAFGQLERTLLIDCDLRKPSTGAYLNIPPNQVGLGEVLAGMRPAEDAIKHFAAANIDLLLCPKTPPNPAELLGSPKFAELLDSLSAQYDRIVIDSPPCQVVSDGLLIAQHVDSVIFLARADSTYRRTVAGAIDRIHQANGKLLGTVINQAQLDKASQYGMYYYPDYYGTGSQA